VQIDVSAELIEQLNAGRLDVVFAKRPLGTSKGRLVWREPLVWTAADTFDLVPGAALPLALYRGRSCSREAALAALRDAELTWEIVYTSPSLTGVRAAALAGSPLRRFRRAQSSRACAFSMPRNACRVYPISSSLSTKRQGRTPQRRSPQLCWRSRKVHRARRSEMAKYSNPPEVGYVMGQARLSSPI
jgi:DNA-binding transcriptional LysR family regulator